MEAQEDFSQSPFFKDLDLSNIPPLPYIIPRPDEPYPINSEIEKLTDAFRRCINPAVNKLFDGERSTD